MVDAALTTVVVTIERSSQAPWLDCQLVPWDWRAVTHHCAQTVARTNSQTQRVEEQSFLARTACTSIILITLNQNHKDHLLH